MQAAVSSDNTSTSRSFPLDNELDLGLDDASSPGVGWSGFIVFSSSMIAFYSLVFLSHLLDIRILFHVVETYLKLDSKRPAGESSLPPVISRVVLSSMMEKGDFSLSLSYF